MCSVQETSDSFPSKLTPPGSYDEARTQRKKEISRSILRAVSVRAFIVGAELFGTYYFGSAALLLDAIASSVDILFSLLLLWGIRLAQAAPDENHPFGHGKIEPLAGLQLALVMILGAAALGGNQLFSLASHPIDEVMSPIAWMIPFGAVVLMELCYRMMKKYAEKNHSAALLADAVHFRIDALNSAFACVALIAAALIPSFSGALDHLGAFLIALLTVVVGVHTAKANLAQLLDQRPDEKFFALVRKAALATEGVLETEKINIQLSGPDAHVDIDVEVDPQMPVDEAHKISQKVRVAIQKAWPAVRDVVVHIEPFYENDH